MRKRRCRWCRDELKPGQGEAFCPKNPNAEKNRELWRNGKKFQTGPRQKPFVLTCVVVPQSPFHRRAI